MPKLIPFKAEHLVKSMNRDDERPEDPMILALKQHLGVAFSIVHDDKIIGSAGILIFTQGVGVVWMAITDAVKQFPLWFHRTTKRILEDQIRFRGLHRVETVVLADNERNIKWAERLGFTREGGIAHEYTTDKRDAIRYELVGRVLCKRYR